MTLQNAKCTKILAGLLVLMTLGASAQTVSFKPAQAYAVGTAPVSVALGDFNGDGVPDLAVASQGSNNVSVLLGKGDGTFQPAVTFDAGVLPNGVAVADLNADGKLDVTVIVSPNVESALPGAVSILFGNGDGTFQPPMVITLNPQQSVVAVVDVNGDKKADLLVNVTDSNSNPAGVALLLGNGDGTFQTSRSVAGESDILLTVADFNHDGKPDLAINTSAAVQLMYGNGDGSFSAGPQVVPSNGGSCAWLRESQLPIFRPSRFTP